METVLDRPSGVLVEPEAGGNGVGVSMARGGTPEAAAALGLLAWQALRDAVPMRS